MRTSITSFYPEDTPIATGLIGEAALPSVINGRIITHESSTLSFAKPFKLKFSNVCTPDCVKK